MIYFHKIVNGLVPNYLSEIKPFQTNCERYDLRRQLNFIAPRCRISKYQRTFLPLAVSLWNKLDDSIKCITDCLAFKNALSPKLTDNPLNLIGNRTDQIIMAKLRLNCSNLKSHLFCFLLDIGPCEQTDFSGQFKTLTNYYIYIY